MALVLLYANHETKGLRNAIHSLKKNGFQYVVIGKDEIWINFMTKIKGYYNYLANHVEANQLVIAIDGYDVLCNKQSTYILADYKSCSNQCILFGAEHLLIPGFKKVNRWWQHNKLNVCDFYFKYVNTGFIMGTCSMLMHFYRKILSYPEVDDQIAAAKYINHYPQNCQLDTCGSFVFNMTGIDIHQADLSDHKSIRVKKTQTVPYFIHCPGSSVDLNTRLETVGHYLLETEHECYSWNESVSWSFVSIFAGLSSICAWKQKELFLIVLISILFFVFFYWIILNDKAVKI